MEDEKVIAFLSNSIIATESKDAEGYYKIYDLRDAESARYNAGYLLQGKPYCVCDNEDMSGVMMKDVDSGLVINRDLRFMGYISKDKEKDSFYGNIIRFPHVPNKIHVEGLSIHNKIKPKKEWRIYAEISDAF